MLPGYGASSLWLHLGSMTKFQVNSAHGTEIGAYPPPFRRAADAIEVSDLDYTILRPAWLTDNDEIDYETTEKDEPFKGTEASRKSVVDLIMKIIESPTLHSKGNNVSTSRTRMATNRRSIEPDPRDFAAKPP